MPTPKDEGIDNWFFKFLNRYLFYIPYCFYTLHASIAFGKQNDLT
jgi:hypothetical protein